MCHTFKTNCDCQNKLLIKRAAFSMSNLQSAILFILHFGIALWKFLGIFDKEERKMIWIILGSVLLFVLILIFCFLIYIYKILFFSPRKGQNKELKLDSALDYQGTEEEALSLTKTLLELPYEDLYTTSKDGLKLHAYFYKNEKSDQFVLMFNGYRGMPRRDFSGGAKALIDLGINVLLCDERAHDKSEGHSITFGRKEQYDVLSWINFVQEKWGKSVKITIVGISMGGGTVLLASDKIDPSIKVIADCPYSKEKDVIMHSMKRLGYPAKLFWPFVQLSSIIFSHASLRDDAMENVSKSKCKILIIHGTHDSIVPHQMSERIYEANKDHVQYEKFEGVEHGLSFIKDKKRYTTIVKKFIGL